MNLSEALEKGFAVQQNDTIKLVKNTYVLVVDIFISDWLDCSKNQLTTLEINQPIGGSLYCSNNQLTTLEINQPIGGSLYCSNNKLTSLIINQPIGDWLNCSNNQLTTLEINQPIGCGLDCSNNHLESKPKYEQLKKGDSGKNWVYFDDILTIFKHKKTYKGYTIYTCVFDNSTKYAVTNGTHSAHARTIKQAIIDIRFKEMDRNADDYRDLGLDDKLSYKDAIIMYRIITGACSGGTEQFLTQHPELSTRKKYSINEIIALTDGQYGNDYLKEFFAQ